MNRGSKRPVDVRVAGRGEREVPEPRSGRIRINARQLPRPSPELEKSITASFNSVTTEDVRRMVRIIFEPADVSLHEHAIDEARQKVFEALQYDAHELKSALENYQTVEGNGEAEREAISESAMGDAPSAS